MNVVDEYILQRFPHKDTGKLETDKPYQCRICWYKLGYPPAEELEKHCNSTKSSISNYMSWYGWSDIKKHAIELQAEQDLIELHERQKATEEKHRRINNKLSLINEEYLDYLIEKLTDTELLYSEKEPLREELRETRKELSSIQRDERTTEHLPNAYKDLTGDLKLQSQNQIELTDGFEDLKNAIKKSREIPE